MLSKVGPDRGMVMDFAEVDALLSGIKQRVDHQFLNDVLTTDDPTSEHIARWIADQVLEGDGLEGSAHSSLPYLYAVTVSETAKSSATYYVDGP
jgi:6-pyruvoyltetrahydropterin/6-carboxytetrahydropterin synthase